MKKMSLFLLFFCSTMSFADQVREQFLQANAVYQEGKPQSALLLYNALEKKDPSVWFNKGLCYFVLEKYPQALAALCQARRNANRRLLGKIEPLLQRVQDHLHIPHDGKWYKMVLWVTAGSALLFQLLFLLFLALYTFFITFRKIRGWVGFFLKSSLLILGCLCALCYWVDHQRIGIIIQEKATLFAGPHKEFHGVTDLRAGQEVKVVEQDQSWYKVDFHGVQGWIEKSEFERII